VDVQCTKHGRQPALYAEDGDKKSLVCRKCYNEVLNRKILKITRDTEVIDFDEYKRKRREKVKK